MRSFVTDVPSEGAIIFACMHTKIFAHLVRLFNSCRGLYIIYIRLCVSVQKNFIDFVKYRQAGDLRDVGLFRVDYNQTYE